MPRKHIHVSGTTASPPSRLLLADCRGVMAVMEKKRITQSRPMEWGEEASHWRLLPAFIVKNLLSFLGAVEKRCTCTDGRLKVIKWWKFISLGWLSPWFTTVTAHPDFRPGDTRDERRRESGSGLWQESRSTVSHLSLSPPPRHSWCSVSPPLPLLRLFLRDFQRRGVHIVMPSSTHTSLSSTGAPWKKCSREKGEKIQFIFWNIRPAHSHLPLQTLPVGTSTECAQGVCACIQKHTVRRSKPAAADLRLERRRALPLLPLHIVNKVNKHQHTLSTSSCSRCLTWNQCFLRINVTRTWPQLELERQRQKVGVSPPAPWHLWAGGASESAKGHGGGAGGGGRRLWTLASGQMAGLDPRTC